MKWLHSILGFCLIVTGIAWFGYMNNLYAQEVPQPEERPYEWTPRWVEKPVSCGPLDQIAQVSKSKGLQIVWRGTGVGNSQNLGPVRVDIFLSINPETQEWALTEIGPTPNEGCLLGYGEGHQIDLDNLKLFQEEFKG